MDTATYQAELVWSHFGMVNPSVAQTGKPWVAPCDLTLDALILTLDSLTLTLEAAWDVALSVGTVVDGAVQRTDTIGSGAHVVSHSLDVPMKAGQTLHPVLLPAPSGTEVKLWIVYRCSRT